MEELELLHQAELSVDWIHEFVVESNKIDPQPSGNEPGFLLYDGHREAALYAIRMAAEGHFALPNAIHKLLLRDHPLAEKLRTHNIKIGLNCILEARFVHYLLWRWNWSVKNVMNHLRTARNIDSEDKVAEVWALHCEFENIHPYELYNGKVGRILMLNHALLADIDPWVIPCTSLSRECYFDLIRNHPSANWGLNPPINAAILPPEHFLATS